MDIIDRLNEADRNIVLYITRDRGSIYLTDTSNEIIVDELETTVDGNSR
jgi:hypothetical protein